MVRQIEWSAESIDDLAAIRDYLLEQTPANAERIVREIESAAELLIDFPYAHRMVPEWQDPDRRETFVYRWRLIYRVTPDRIRIVGVIHGSRLLGNIENRAFEEGRQAEYIAS